MSSKLRLFLIENAVVILFVVLIAFAIPVAGLPGTFLWQEILTRLGRNTFLVIALLLPIMAGMGLNFGMTLGAMAGQIGLILVADWQIWGIPGIILAMIVSIPISVGLGLLCGKILNMAKGREMVTGYITSYFFNGIYQMVVLYMMGAVLKRHHDEGAPEADKPLLAWAFHNSAYEIELALSQALRNFPIKPLGWLLWPLVFPLGRRAVAPGDRLSHRVAMLLMAPNEARERLADGVFLTPGENNPGGRINSYLAKAILAEPVERKFLKALKTKDIEALDFASQLDEGVREGWITADERKQLEELHAITLDTITVDDFEAHELRAASYYDGRADGSRRAVA